MSVLYQDLKIGITCAIFRNLKKKPSVNDLSILLGSMRDKGDLIHFIVFVEYVQILELLFFKGVMILSFFLSLQVNNRMSLV